MAYTMADFQRDYVKRNFPMLTVAERLELLNDLPSEARRELLASLPLNARREMLEMLPLEERFAGLTPEQIQQYLDSLTTPARKPRRKR